MKKHTTANERSQLRSLCALCTRTQQRGSHARQCGRERTSRRVVLTYTCAYSTYTPVYERSNVAPPPPLAPHRCDRFADVHQSCGRSRARVHNKSEENIIILMRVDDWSSTAVRPCFVSVCAIVLNTYSTTSTAYNTHGNDDDGRMSCCVRDEPTRCREGRIVRAI